MQQVQCEGCGESRPHYDFVSYGTTGQGYRQLCSRCFNAEVVKQTGQEGFENVRFEPVGMLDNAGEWHEFHFRTRLLGNVVALDAFEVSEGNPAGYQFQAVGDPDGDVLDLLGQLIEKMRRALSVQHLTDTEHGLQIADQMVRGRIEWDDSKSSGRRSLLWTVGRSRGEEFGRMLMAFEGWQFKLEISDPSEEP